MSAPDQTDPNAPPTPDAAPPDAPTTGTTKKTTAKAAPPSPGIGGGAHFVLNGEAESVGKHRPAVIVEVDDGENVHLQVFTLSTDGERYANGHYEALNVSHDEDTKAPGTWHWPE